jgi:pyridoxine kinase
MTKRILTMQDLSCVGQCSLTVALPILSAYDVEACVLPTAVLSNHTMFKSFSYLDLTDEIPHIFENWKKNGLTFDAFLLGYLGKQSLMNLTEECFDTFAAKGARVIIDPVFADNGKLYGGFDLNYVKAMAHLIRRADIILPNITEACFLTETEYKESYNTTYIEDLVQKLTKLTSGVVIITGVQQDGKIGEVIYQNGKYDYVMLEKLPQSKHGTGDIFASVFTAKLLAGASLAESCKAAGQFVADCLRTTDADHFYGVNFEKVLLSLQK